MIKIEYEKKCKIVALCTFFIFSKKKFVDISLYLYIKKYTRRPFGYFLNFCVFL